MTNKSSVDAITLSTVWHTFQSTCREMRHVLDRTAQNYLMAQLHDVAAGIWDAQARPLAVPAGPTSQLLGQKFSVRYILDKWVAALECNWRGLPFLANVAHEPGLSSVGAFVFHESTTPARAAQAAAELATFELRLFRAALLSPDEGEGRLLATSSRRA